jgi:hypothetical protein
VGDFILARKNEIFTAQGQKAPIEVPGGIIKQDVMKEFGWEVPVDVAPLPSQGRVYPPSSSLHGKEIVSIKAMTAKEEDILMSRAYSKQGTTVIELIKSCLADKSIDPADLLLGDRHALLVAIRITGYGSSYSVDASCPKCSVTDEYDFDLSSLPIRNLEIEPIKPGVNEFAFTLPVSKKNVTFKFMTGRDDLELTLTNERKKKILGEQADNSITSRLTHQIVSIDGITDRNKIATFVNNMPARDSKALRLYMDKNEPTLEMTTTMTCNACGASSEVGLPIGISFFWPRD